MISIIVLNWNGKPVLRECLDSIEAQKFKNYETLVVDNASTDNSQDIVKKDFPKMRLIQNKKNKGYAGGNNEGVKKAKGRWILILNNDVVLDKNFLKELWANKNKADILGVKNYYFDKKKILWAIGSKVNKITMRASLIGNKEEDFGQYDQTNIEHAIGSAMLINKKVINKIGFLDESFFAYYEETEWQTHAKKHGFTVSWVPSAKLWHRVAYSTGGGRSPLSAYYLVRNRGYYIRKWSPHKFIAYLFWIFEIIARFIYGLIKDRKYSQFSFRGMMDFFRGVKGKLN
jgi:GT2 family glycosyltransferase